MLFAARHALSVGFAVFIAVIVNHYLSFSKEGWIILAAFMVSQTTRGTPLKQGLVYFFLIAMVALVMPPHDAVLMQDRMIDIVIGAMLGVLFSQLIFPVKVYSEFCLGVTPVLQALLGYSREFSRAFVYRNNTGPLEVKNVEIEAALDVRLGVYPEWIYEVGFNPGLRSGYRYFLVNLERITELFFSMNYLAHRGIEITLLSEFSQYLSDVIEKNNELLAVLVDYFSKGKLTNIESESDFTSDMAALEEILNRYVPSNLELLDISPDNVTLTALVRDLKDLRGLLLQLVMALPASA